MPEPIDPRDFGRLEAEVQALRDSNQALGAELAELRADVRKLLDMASQGKGGLWMFNAIFMGVGGAAVWLLENLVRK